MSYLWCDWPRAFRSFNCCFYFKFTFILVLFNPAISKNTFVVSCFIFSLLIFVLVLFILLWFVIIRLLLKINHIRLTRGLVFLIVSLFFKEFFVSSLQDIICCIHGQLKICIMNLFFKIRMILILSQEFLIILRSIKDTSICFAWDFI